MLEIKQLSVGYPRPAMVRDVTLTVHPGERVALLGPNGAGKSTLLRGITSLAHRLAGSVIVDGRVVAADPKALVDAGVAYVPEGRHVFPAMTVEENLTVAALSAGRTRPRAASIVRSTLEALPMLGEMRDRRAGALSGGQQQLVAIARALSQEPRYLLIDEPSLGLSPVAVDAVYDRLHSVVEIGVAVLLVEQNVELALALCDRGYVLHAGDLVTQGTTDELLRKGAVQNLYLGAF